MEKNFSKREANKVIKKAALVDAAEKLFVQKGYENTSIDEVARAAGLTKKTLYQYFESKEDLFYAVALKGARILGAAYESGLEEGRTTLEKIHLANMAYLQFHIDHNALSRILNYRPANQENVEASPHFREFTVVDSVRMRHLSELAASAVTDGSINPSLDPKQAVFFAFFTAFCILYTVSATDKTMWEMLNFDENDYLRFCFEILTNAIKP
jgi:AcrR family transcriptional regulator